MTHTNRYLLIENRGEAELAAITLMGASSKRDDAGKIGLFGTGFKNAISIFLRKKVGVTLFFGDTRVECSTKPVNFRDKTFDVIILTMNGREIETGFTTDMGLRWEVDGAVREIVSNALDEPSPVVTEWTDAFAGLKGRTRVFVEMTTEIESVYKNIGSHFLKLRNTKPRFSAPGVELWPKFDSDGVRFYRKGVLVHETDGLCCFDYNIDSLNVDEERKASPFECEWEFGHKVDSFPKEAKSAILPFISQDSFEARCGHLGELSSPDWKDLFEGRAACSSDILDGPMKSLLPLEKCVRVTSKWENALAGAGVVTSARLLSKTMRSGGVVVPATELEERGLEWAIGFAHKAGFEVERDAIQVFKSGDGITMGEWDEERGKILIARECLARGRRYLITTLIEEICHRDSKQADCTRGFQDFIFEKLVTALEQQQGVYL